MYSMKVTTNAAPYYRKYLLDTLYRYASTPLDKRDEPLYKIGIKDTTLYLIHINDREMTVTAYAKEVKNVTD